MKEITQEQLFRYFRNETSKEEENMIDAWLEASPVHRKEFSDAFFLFEAYTYDSVKHQAAEVHQARRARKPGRIALILSVAAVVAIFCTLTYNIMDAGLNARLSRTMVAVAVPAGQRLDLTLEDGTEIRLNSGAVLQYPKAFSRKCREVHLDGEAYFDVARDEGKTFIVKTFVSEIEVLGTEFNVNADEEAGTFSATLVEGSVRLSNSLLPGEHIIMHPNEKVTLVKDHMILEERNASKDIRWTEGILNVGGCSFDELVRRLERAFGVDIELNCTELPELQYTGGELRISDGIDAALRTLQNVSDFTYRRDPSTGTIVISTGTPCHLDRP